MPRGFIPCLDSGKLAWMDAREKWSMHGGTFGEKQRWDPGKVDESYFKRIGYKVLSTDDGTGATTYLVLHGANLRRVDQREIGYHKHVEESFILYGDIREYRSLKNDIIEYEDRKSDWCYFYRPPGWVHGGDVLRDSVSLKTQDGPSTQTLVSHELLQKNALYSDMEKAIGGRGFIKTFDSRLIPWTPINQYLVTQGKHDIANHAGLHVKVLSRDVYNGAQTLLLKMEPGFANRVSGYSSVARELFVLEGEMIIGEHELKVGCYSYCPAGTVTGPVVSDKGCTCWCTATGPTDFVIASEADVGKNLLGNTHTPATV